MKILALIAARSGSQGLRHKNLRKLNNTPLLVHAVRLAQRTKTHRHAWSIVVSTDATTYAKVATDAGAEVPFLRPPNLAKPKTPLRDVVLHALKQLHILGRDFDVVILLSATTPFTQPQDVRRALALWQRTKTQSVISVTLAQEPESHRLLLEQGTLYATSELNIGRRQDAPTRWVLNGAIYVASPTWLYRYRQFFVSGQTLPLTMPKDRSLDIDDSYDMKIAQCLWRPRP